MLYPTIIQKVTIFKNLLWSQYFPFITHKPITNSSLTGSIHDFLVQAGQPVYRQPMSRGPPSDSSWVHVYLKGALINGRQTDRQEQHTRSPPWFSMLLDSEAPRLFPWSPQRVAPQTSTRSLRKAVKLHAYN